MQYIACVGGGESERVINVAGVNNLEVVEGAYFLYDENKDVLFTAPIDSVLYIGVA